MIKFLTLLLLLAYFWYWTATTSIRNIPKPSSPEPSVPDLFNYSLESDGKNFNLVINGHKEWTVKLPQETIFDKKAQKFLDKDDCIGVPDGASIVATGENLYKYLSKHDVASTRKFQVFSATDYLQNGNVFYFACKDNKIDHLEMCPSGQIFLEGSCQKINACLDKPSGYTFANLLSLSTFYECPGNNEPAKLQYCDAKTFFFHDSCRTLQDFDIFCRNHKNSNDIILIDSSTRLVCQNDGKANFKKCPKGQLYFDGVCESAECLGKPDGTRIASETQRRGLLHYHPGYLVCKNHRVDHTVTCPKEWDKYFAPDRAALSLPKVFDGVDCAVPKFCVNVWSNNPDAIVPAYNFLKHVRNWKYSGDMDNIVGFVCEDGKTRKRKNAPHGYLIDSKRLKIYPSSKDKTFLADRFDAYYDNNSKSVVACKNNYIFDGTDCRPQIENAFSHGGLGLFRMTDDEWIKGWTYIPQTESVPNCTEPESVYLSTYNACFHPDCVLYPFLSQASNFFIALKERGYICHGKNFNLVSKERINYPFDYWSQRRLDKPSNDERCVPGSKIQSGHFVFDSLIYATCNDSQPFVFCPYKNTEGIILVDDKRWACKPTNTETAIMEGYTTRHFEANELKAIRPIYGGTFVRFRGTQNPLNAEMEMPKNQSINLWASKSIKLVFRYLHTFPPDVAYKDGQPILSNIDEGGALLIKREGFTKHSVTIPKFDGAVETLPDFDV